MKLIDYQAFQQLPSPFPVTSSALSGRSAGRDAPYPSATSGEEGANEEADEEGEAALGLQREIWAVHREEIRQILRREDACSPLLKCRVRGLIMRIGERRRPEKLRFDIRR